jgi:hypothetical protein
MAWKVVECRSKNVPWNGETEGDVYWALLIDRETGDELEFELFDGVYYVAEDEEDEEGSVELMGIIEVTIDGVVEFSEIFSLKDRRKILRRLVRDYGDIINAISSKCGEIDFIFD